MSISTTDERRAGPYATDGVQTDFTFEFKVFNAEDLVVTSSEDGIETVLIHETDYTVDLNADQEDDPGGTVIIDPELDGPTVTITSDMDYTQPTVFTNAGGFYPRVLNDSLDRVTILIQQLKEKLSRALLAPFDTEPIVGYYPVVLADGSYGFSTGTGSDAALRGDLAADGAPLIGIGETDLDEVLIKTPREFGATGVGDDLAALQEFFDALGDGVHGFCDDTEYTISARLVIQNKSNFYLFGQMRLKLADGAGGATPNELYSGILMQGCSDFFVQGITINGNRDNRTTIEASGHLWRVLDCHDGEFDRCGGINGTTDGLYVRGSDPADEATYPSDLTWTNSLFENNYRNNASVVGAIKPHFDKCKFRNANGTPPEAGIDFEPNAGVDADLFGVQRARLTDCEVTDNNGCGVILTGNVGVSGVTDMVISGLTGSGNKGITRYTTGVPDRWGGAFITVSTASQNTTITDVVCYDHPDFAPDSSTGLIEIDAAAGRTEIISPRFFGITNADAQVSCIHDDGSGNVHVSDFGACDIACGALFMGGRTVLEGVYVKNSTYSASVVHLLGANSVGRDITILGHTGTYGLYCGGARPDIAGVYAEDCAGTVAAVRFDSNATNAIIKDIHVHQTVGVPVGSSALRIDTAPLMLGDIVATGGYTTSNLIFAANGLFANTILSRFNPDILSGSGAFDPASIPAGTGINTTSNSIAHAATGDRVHATPPYDMQGVTYHARVTANGVITLDLFNPTAGAIDLGLGTWKYKLLKS